MDEPLNLIYDQKRDVLYLHYGPPRPAISEEIEPGCLIRRDFETNEVVGITVIGFAKRGEWKLPRQRAIDSVGIAAQDTFSSDVQ